jgi:hypothetical protein
MMSLDEARWHTGWPVIYRSHPGAMPEVGKIKSVNDFYVFVQYAGDTGAKATRPEDLELVQP